MCDRFCDCQMLRLAGSYDLAKTYLGILACYYFWTVTPPLQRIQEILLFLLQVLDQDQV